MGFINYINASFASPVRGLSLTAAIWRAPFNLEAYCRLQGFLLEKLAPSESTGFRPRLRGFDRRLRRKRKRF